MRDPRLPHRHQVRYRVHIGDAVTDYPGDRYRVRFEFGALIVYLRQVQTISDGDNDIPLLMYGNGEWDRVETICDPPIEVAP